MASRKVILKGSGIRKEDDAGGTITPGMLLNYDSNGDVIAHENAGQNAVPDFAVEEDFLGTDIDSTYASSDRVQHDVCFTGMEVNAFLIDPENVSKGDFLESDGAGNLRAHTPPEGALSGDAIQYNSIVARALEDKDNSGGSAAVRIVVEIV